MYHKRRQLVQKSLRDKNISGLFVTNPKNIFYLSGFIGISPSERESFLLITQHTCFLFAPAMYEKKAKQCVDQSLESPLQIVIDEERHGLFRLIKTYGKDLDTIMVESHNMTLVEHEKLQSVMPSKIISQPFFIESFRLKKDAQEIACIQKACEITDQSFEALVEFLKSTDYTQLTEQDVAEQLRKFGKQYGADAWGFEPIVACGPGSAEPHYVTGTQLLQKNQPLLLDFGFSFHGYTADLSRTIFLGHPTEEHKKIYSLVKECQQLCIDSWRDGMTGKDMHTISLNFFQKVGVEKHYLHSLGHGVGLDVHEQPGIGLHGQHVLLENMVFTIEPGLYFANNFGVRIEDIVLVKNNKLVVLSGGSRKELIVI